MVRAPTISIVSARRAIKKSLEEIFLVRAFTPWDVPRAIKNSLEEIFLVRATRLELAQL